AALKFLPQTIANAQSTTIEAGATITADGTSGAGGNVVVWSDGTTSFAGAISTQGLHGGFIETSGHVFNLTGGSVNAGRGGAWLRADNAGTGTGTVTFGGGQVSTAGAVSIFYNPTGSNSTINATKYTAPTQTTFSGNVTGGATLKTYMLVNTIYDLQNMNNNK